MSKRHVQIRAYPWYSNGDLSICINNTVEYNRCAYKHLCRDEECAKTVQNRSKNQNQKQKQNKINVHVMQQKLALNRKTWAKIFRVDRAANEVNE